MKQKQSRKSQSHKNRPQRNQPHQKPTHQNPIRLDLYGTHAVTEALKNPARKIKALYGTKEALQKIMRPDESKDAQFMHEVSRADLDSMLPKGAVHQGLALSCSDLPETNIQDFIIKSEQANHEERSLILILDQITDPQNVGAIIRSACAFGASGLVMQRKHAPELTGALAKAACGGIEYVPVAFETNLSRTIEALQEVGFMVYGLDERGENDIQNADFPAKSALVLGAEGPGLRRLIKEKCDQLLRIPITKQIASINVSNAAATTLFAWQIKQKN